jgi:hypothetical protein
MCFPEAKVVVPGEGSKATERGDESGNSAESLETKKLRADSPEISTSARNIDSGSFEAVLALQCFCTDMTESFLSNEDKP